MRTEPPVPPEALGRIRAALTPNAQAVDAPILQPLGLLLDLAGEAMRARLFVVQAEGGSEACLRPDFTVAVARRHIEGGGASGRYFYEGPAFRAARGEEPDEFVQMGVEQFAPAGEAAPPADAEIAAAAWRAAAAGGRKDLTLWLGDVGLFSAFIDSLSLPAALAARLKRVAGRPRMLAAELARAGEAPKEALESSRLAGLLAGRSPEEATALLEEVWALAGIEPVGGRRPAEIAARLARRSDAAAAPALGLAEARAIGEFMAISDVPAAGLPKVKALAGRKAPALDKALDDWLVRLEALAEAAPVEAMRFAPALGHAFDYYDGLTFEIRSQALGAERPVAVGGRYDGLLARLGGQSGRAVGCMVRPWRAFAGGEA
ncbi:ATP phosphoribosyltransferase regulatory subunit [Phenylobacterium soli]|uniref:ATP phosphoribosyltransferase regulatory subunit n=1 Tax=Phenylobacterium soli TaxID=2170551 RepID=A0A328AGR1_9CAUL|nr:ATP phosphoribosyltransferase regulatory subunit [Phenylobacterium soli]RAK53920.1 ATP phosphoribosyltransferase regulatory subunit [Phenylobacterium soli]